MHSASQVGVARKASRVLGEALPSRSRSLHPAPVPLAKNARVQPTECHASPSSSLTSPPSAISTIIHSLNDERQMGHLLSREKQLEQTQRWRHGKSTVLFGSVRHITHSKLSSPSPAESQISSHVKNLVLWGG